MNALAKKLAEIAPPRPLDHKVSKGVTAFIKERQGFIPEDMVAACVAAQLDLSEPHFWQFNAEYTALVRRH